MLAGATLRRGPIGRGTSSPRDPDARPKRPPDDLAAEAARARTPCTPLLALTGVWLAFAAVVVVVVAVALTLYFVYGRPLARTVECGRRIVAWGASAITRRCSAEPCRPGNRRVS